MQLLFIALALGLVGTAVDANPYCAISSTHYLCLYPKPTYGPDCQSKATRIPATGDIAKALLDAHNKYRDLVASGKETKGAPGCQPKASNMREMVWSEELAKIAQQHTDLCKFKHATRDSIRTSTYSYVGENLAMWGPINTKYVKAVDMWYSEVANQNGNDLTFTWDPALPVTGHYTQVVWADSLEVGCGITNLGAWNRVYVSCMYGPAGNWLGAQIYKQGEPASACPSGTSKSSKYPNLCAKSSKKNDMSYDHFDYSGDGGLNPMNDRGAYVFA